MDFYCVDAFFARICRVWDDDKASCAEWRAPLYHVLGRVQAVSWVGLGKHLSPFAAFEHNVFSFDSSVLCEIS